MTTRVPLVRDQLDETAYIARKAGALILGRALGHAHDQDGASFRPFTFARDAGFDTYCADLAAAAYTDLLTGTGL